MTKISVDPQAAFDQASEAFGVAEMPALKITPHDVPDTLKRLSVLKAKDVRLSTNLTVTPSDLQTFGLSYPCVDPENEKLLKSARLGALAHLFLDLPRLVASKFVQGTLLDAHSKLFTGEGRATLYYPCTEALAEGDLPQQSLLVTYDPEDAPYESVELFMAPIFMPLMKTQVYRETLLLHLVVTLGESTVIYRV